MTAPTDRSAPSDPSRDDRPARVAAWLVAALAGAALVAITLPAILPGTDAPADVLARFAFAPACHQSAERSFAGDGGACAVCARCHGLYAGGFAGAIVGAGLAAWRRRALRWLFAAAVVPTLVQWVSVRLGAPDPSNLVRFALALPAGVACGWFLAAGAGDLGSSIASWLRHRFLGRTAPPAGAAPSS